MDAHQHWQQIYAAKSAPERSWYAPHLETSLALIRRGAPDLSTPILDVGAGESTLADDLLASGYSDITLLDISDEALAHTRARLGSAASQVQCLAANILTAALPQQHLGLWHDRAVFHFLTEPADRAAYVAQATAALRPGGRLILATFGPDGPTRCSGVPVQRHDAASILRDFGNRFRLLDSRTETHTTPTGTTQQFLYCDLQHT